MRVKKLGLYLVVFLLTINLSSCGSGSSFGIPLTPAGTPTPTVSPTANPHHADVVIFSAHPDDETFNCATVIQQALAEGKSVHVVIFTNGDGWEDSATLVTGKPRAALVPDDYILLARIRQNETLGAMSNLGLDPSAITFLGYPDGGLDKIYNNPGSEPFTQRYTLKNSTYGPSVPDYHTQAYGTPASYLRENVLMDVTGLLQEWNPDQVYVHSAASSHMDHRAVFWFVREAYKALGLERQVNTFSVDYVFSGSGTCPAGQDCHLPVQVTPTDEQARTKYNSLLKYQSQIEPIFATSPGLKSMGLYNFSVLPEAFWPMEIP
jgi:LmbE family N-acetylglucosaminyl deacetylase